MDKNMTDSPSAPLSREERLRDIGKRLHEARQGQNIPIQEIAGRLNFSVGQAKALESGDWSDLPDYVYGLGFVRQYAIYLGLDINDDIRDLKASVSLTHPITIPDPAIAPTRHWAWIALLLFVALAVYYNMQGLESDDMLSSSIEPPAPQVNTTVAIPEPSPATIEAATPQTVDQPAEVAQEEPVPSAEETAATAPSDDSSEETQDVATTNDQASAVGHELIFSASGGDVWLRINAATSDGSAAAKLKETLLRDGQNITFNTERNLLVFTAGNALKLAITVDGKVTHARGSLGKDGKVVRDMALSLDSAD